MFILNFLHKFDYNIYQVKVKYIIKLIIAMTNE